MNAHEARAITNEAQALDGDYKRKETDQILAAIKAAANRGSGDIYVYDAIYSDKIIVKRLKALDYQVEITDDQRDGWAMTISW